MSTPKNRRRVWVLLGGFCLLTGLVLALCAAFSFRLPELVGRELT